MKSNAEIKSALNCLWNFGYDIVMEGILASTIHSTYADMFTDLLRIHEVKREIIIFSIIPPVEVCLQRVKERNIGKPIHEERFLNKYRSCISNVPKFAADGFNSMRVDNSNVPIEDTLTWFSDLCGLQF